MGDIEPRYIRLGPGGYRCGEKQLQEHADPGIVESLYHIGEFLLRAAFVTRRAVIRLGRIVEPFPVSPVIDSLFCDVPDGKAIPVDRIQGQRVLHGTRLFSLPWIRLKFRQQQHSMIHTLVLI